MVAGRTSMPEKYPVPVILVGSLPEQIEEEDLRGSGCPRCTRKKTAVKWK